MNGWLSPENMAQLMLLCALLFTMVCSLLAFAGVVYLGGRLVFSFSERLKSTDIGGPA